MPFCNTFLCKHLPQASFLVQAGAAMTNLKEVQGRDNGIVTESVLRNLQIASPCPSDWNNMTGDDRVRHCSACDLNVYNFSAMTEEEVLELIAARQGQRLCARFYQRADGTILLHECPWKWRALKRKAARFAGIALSVMMSMVVARGKNKPSQPTCECLQAVSSESAIALIVVDRDGAVIQNAGIALVNRSSKEHFEGMTEASGKWVATKLRPGKYELTVQSPGFMPLSKVVKVVHGHIAELKIVLPIAPVQETVQVKAQPLIMVGVVGMITTTQPADVPLPSGRGDYRPMHQ
jgi:hypothetical protein